MPESGAASSAADSNSGAPADSGAESSAAPASSQEPAQTGDEAGGDDPTSAEGAASTFDPAGDVKPTDANTVADITAWLDAHSIDHTGKTVKADLLALVPAD
ncbi:hypothetical protein [Loigolactobacillus bifermentans]|uniref:HeH/LEM domain-containing protein n=1 Tax=Loigolactobacillus bifermentans DSM 20003 TaxID=1423726 RepID=A0A0R1H9S8_9LACO|nr:hypothetical protein [Loigolactobacillus bifermentans]KRK40804.1 hypothetical protein FC07_GL002553 [Loigolactobacillus bifermentans DSM 20003]QGG59556.1 hypothetical protein LB003_03150 [Loigolactobacillus bifermentans]